MQREPFCEVEILRIFFFSNPSAAQTPRRRPVRCGSLTVASWIKLFICTVYSRCSAVSQYGWTSRDQSWPSGQTVPRPRRGAGCSGGGPASKWSSNSTRPGGASSCNRAQSSSSVARLRWRKLIFAILFIAQRRVNRCPTRRILSDDAGPLALASLEPVVSAVSLVSEFVSWP
jgi:hypothetical protein